jgi:hypothetical protein
MNEYETITYDLDRSEFEWDYSYEVGEYEEQFPEGDEPSDGFRDDVEADADALASAGWGTDEDYGYYGDYEY